jgi:hypothetical protein
MKKIMGLAAGMAIAVGVTFPALAESIYLDDETTDMLTERARTQIIARICRMWEQGYTDAEVWQTADYLVRINRTEILPENTFNERVVRVHELSSGITAHLLIMSALGKCMDASPS